MSSVYRESKKIDKNKRKHEKIPRLGDQIKRILDSNCFFTSSKVIRMILSKYLINRLKYLRPEYANP